MEIEPFIGGRNPFPIDAQNLLCGVVLSGKVSAERSRTLVSVNKRASASIVNMINGIQIRKEEDERMQDLLGRMDDESIQMEGPNSKREANGVYATTASNTKHCGEGV